MIQYQQRVQQTSQNLNCMEVMSSKREKLLTLIGESKMKRVGKL